MKPVRTLSPTLTLSNAQARALWLDRHGLLQSIKSVVDIAAMVEDLGFVQLDTIQNVARAHHHILWSRNPDYREADLYNHYAKHQSLFEHFTHDASILPLSVYPYWQMQFEKLGKITGGYTRTKNAQKIISSPEILEKIRTQGPLCTRDFQTKLPPKQTRKSGEWHRPPHKILLDQLWYAGVISTSGRQKFVKYYDLHERVIPARYRKQNIPHQQQIDYLCRRALRHIGFGSAVHIQKFWDVCSAQQVRDWIETQLQTGDIVIVNYTTHQGDVKSAYGLSNIKDQLAACPKPSTKIRILNPFDPAIRDRKRMADLFGFDFKIEIFVPAAKRKYGYYVYPILQGSHLIGRVDLKAVRAKSELFVQQIWWEQGIKPTEARQRALDVQIRKIAKFIGVKTVKAGTP